MLATQTEIVPPRPRYYTLRLIIPTLGVRLDQFLDILQRHENDRDQVGLSLLNWGREVALLIADADETQGLPVQLAAKIEELRRRVLVNPLDCSPIRHPVVMRGRLWEAEMLAHVREITSLDPFDGGPSTDGVSHSFADEMLRFVDSLLRHPGDESLRELIASYREREESWDRSGWLDVRGVRGVSAGDAAVSYTTLARNAVSCEETEQLSAILRSASDNLAVYILRADESKRESLQRLRETLQRSAQASREQLDVLVAINRTIRDSLQEQLRVAREELRCIQGRVSVAEGEVQRLTQRMQGLESNVAQCRAENATMRADMRRANRGVGCVIS